MSSARTEPSNSIALYALGSNGSGQLGIGHNEDVSVPQRVIPRRQRAMPVTIACGGNHSIILFDDHEIVAAGANDDGRCVAIEETKTNKFVHVRLPLDEDKVEQSGILQVTATWSATIATCHSGAVWSCGTGDFGELGLSMKTKIARRPTPIVGFPPSGTNVVKLASCMGHVVAVLSSGEAWGWGKGRQGQLGQPPEHVWSPRRIQGVHFFVVDAVCGKDFTCLFGNPTEGELMMFGPTDTDRFGVRQHAPTSVHGWKQVGASWGSVFILLESGQLVGWGRNNHGQLPPSNLPLLHSFAAGSEHCLGLTLAGRVIAWGWGEHGNCGPTTDSNGDVRGQWSELETRQLVTAVFAGCATSFIVTNEQQHTITGTPG